MVVSPPRWLQDAPAYAIGSLAAFWLIQRVAAFGQHLRGMKILRWLVEEAKAIASVTLYFAACFVIIIFFEATLAGRIRHRV